MFIREYSLKIQELDYHQLSSLINETEIPLIPLKIREESMVETRYTFQSFTDL